jgi:hypothetical protein
MPTLKIGTRSQATRILASRQLAGLPAKRERWDTAKYSEPGYGKTAEVPEHVLALWTAKYKDENGEYYGLNCITTQA